MAACPRFAGRSKRQILTIQTAGVTMEVLSDKEESFWQETWPYESRTAFTAI